MMITIIRRLRREDEGMALATVLLMGVVLTVLIATGLTLSVSGSVRSGTNRDAGNATAAAYAGLADYQSRLTTDNQYWNYGVTTSFGGSSVFTGTKANPAFDTSKGGAWAIVPNSGGLESFRYEVDNSQFSAGGVVRVRVTGKMNLQTRSIVASLRGTGFIDYLYFTDYESSNPAITGETQATNSKALCLSQHITDAGYDSNKACKQVQFIAKDILRGPVRTNDTFYICGATFQRQVQSTAPNGVYNSPSGCAAPKFQQASSANPQPENVQSFTFPQTNSAMAQETRYDVPTTVPGCLYTGPTSIVFTQEGNVGYMTVVSPWTLATQIAYNADGTMSGRSTGTAATQCGSIADLHSATGAKVKVPANNLVYVQSVPTAAVNTTKDPNWWGPTAVPTSPSSAQFCSKTTPGYYTGPWWNQTYVPAVTTYSNGLTNSNGLGYPATNENTDTDGPGVYYGCRNGDAFVQGKFDGALTVGAQNYLYVTGDILYADATSDILGLVGQTAVQVWNPISCSSTNGDGSCSTASGKSALLARNAKANIEIDAAIASNGGTFQVQNYGFGPQLGTLTVKGSIAQKWRGAVGVTYNGGAYQTGFTKDYGYDDRLKATAPPKYLQPVQTTYGINTQVEVAPAYKADGTPQ